MPGDAVYILDACSVLALLQRESGSQVVASLLNEPTHRCLIHVIHVCEVYYDVFRRDGEDDAAAVPDILREVGIDVVDELQRDLWESAAKLKAVWRRVSLADCFALALALRERATLVTSDHHEFDAIAEAGICPIRFIR